jgi:DNA mismatch endonuclease (patch repair protein)
MADKFSKKKRSQIMAAVKSKGNKATEIRFVQILRKNKISGWRRNFKLFGHPDFVFPNFQIAVFIDGCFWHGCPKHLRRPSDNRKYWTQKILRNRKRDKLVVKNLRQAGWQVIRIWEHELSVANRIARRVIFALEAKINLHAKK